MRSVATAGADLPIQIIQPGRGWTNVGWAELWRYRELLYFLVWRDVKVRYKQTALGALWAVLQPLLQMVVFTIFFGRLAGLDARTEGVPYPAHVYIGLTLWLLFANSVTQSGNSLVGNTNLITKVYFPRLTLPLASIGAVLVDFCISLVILLPLMVYYKISVSWHVALVPVFVTGTLVCAAGVGATLSALTVAYRDFRYVVPFLVQLWMFVTPVIYPVSVVPSSWRWLLALNPMSGLVEGFRAAFLGGPLDWPSTSFSIGMAAAVFLAGLRFFRSVERRFADII